MSDNKYYNSESLTHPTPTEFDNSNYNDYVKKLRSDGTHTDKEMGQLIENYVTNPEILNEETKSIICHNITINSIGSEDFLLKKPITVTIEQRDDEFTACLYEANIFGYGKNIQEAVNDLNEILIETFGFLLEQKKTKIKLGKKVKKQLLILKDLIGKRH